MIKYSPAKQESKESIVVLHRTNANITIPVITILLIVIWKLIYSKELNVTAHLPSI
jgi:hypothetical protein